MVLDSFSLHEDYSTGTFIYTSCPRPPLILISQQLGQSSPIILLSQLELLNDKQSHPSELTFLPQLPPIEHINPATWNSAFLEVFFPCGTGINQFEKAINFANFATLNFATLSFFPLRHRHQSVRKGNKLCKFCNSQHVFRTSRMFMLL